MVCVDGGGHLASTFSVNHPCRADTYLSLPIYVSILSLPVS